MANDLSQLSSIASRIKTPLTLSGIVIFVLYTLYRQILNMGIFSKIDQNSTATLLFNIIDKVYWLAIICTILGVGSYIFTIFLSRNKKRQSSIELVDTHIINGSSNGSKNKQDNE